MPGTLRLFVGTGVEGLRPVGYTTIDIAAEHNPDIVADASSLPMIQSGTADEFYASHVLEHFSWPRGLLVLQEWARVLKVGGILKVAVPDMEIYAHLLLNGRDPFNVVNDIYGGHWVQEGGPQGHHFGYTRRMLIEILTVLGFGQFDVWRSDLQEAANAWMYGENQEKVGLSLNLAAVKQSEPLLDIAALAHRIRYHDIRESFSVLVRSLLADEVRYTDIAEMDAALFQKLNYRFLEATHIAAENRKRYEALAASVGANAASPPPAPEPSNGHDTAVAGGSRGRHVLSSGLQAARRLIRRPSGDLADRMANLEARLDDLAREIRQGLTALQREGSRTGD